VRGLALPLAGGALLALAALALLSGLQPPVASTRFEQAAALSAQLRCPDCAGLSVAESSSGSAQAIRTEVTALLAAGQTPDQVRQHFVDRYGEWILLSPRAPIAWLLPVALLLLAGIGLGAWLLRTGRGQASPPVAAGAAELQRVRDEAEALDA
jgi:Uncharacterized protein involved in biosynthesis of c-type cytochromes